MRRTLIVIVAVLGLAVPAALAAPPAHPGNSENHGKPDDPGKSASAPGQAPDKNPAKKCKALRASNAPAFKTAYGDKPNAYGKCVSAMAKAQNKGQDEAKDETETENEATDKAEDNAAKKCKSMKKDNPSGFKTAYGDKPNAYGKCVSKLAKAKHSS
jgi:uncharacterized membrane protein YdfJ with MMPL/SSD domain